MTNPAIDLELGSTVNAILEAAGLLQDVHQFIAEQLGSFKFIRSFKRKGESGNRKISRVKRKSTIMSRTCSDESSDSLSLSHKGNEGNIILQ